MQGNRASCHNTDHHCEEELFSAVKHTHLILEAYRILRVDVKVESEAFDVIRFFSDLKYSNSRI